jgi:thioredoxin reductase
MELEGAFYRLEPGKAFSERKLLIIGGGDLALDNALRAKESGAEVAILHRSGLKANRGLVEESETSGIRFLKGSAEDISSIDGEFILKDEETFDMAAVFIGRSPERSLIRGFEGIEITDMSHSTSVKGLYLIGDAASLEHSQAAYAMASGVSCAMDIACKVRNDESGPGTGN